ncbi:methyl-accepting chemotaxis protein, partial [Noviherbaspirillum sp. 17J57-3]|nr:methyl-accepting chemotaxis protein [Noviherbaspirillum galbum]
ADIMSEITAASQEQSNGIEQVNLAIAQMDEMTQQNAALVEQAAAAAASMQQQAGGLAQAVAVFNLAGVAAAPSRAALPQSRSSGGRQDQAAQRTAQALPSASAGRSVAVKRPASPAPAGSSATDDWEEF